MKPRRLVLSDEAIDDIARRANVLASARGQAFAVDWSDALLDWLTGCAEAGAQLGTEHPTSPSFRTFGYRRQATILAEFTDDELGSSGSISLVRTGWRSDVHFADTGAPTTSGRHKHHNNSAADVAERPLWSRTLLWCGVR